MTFKTPGVYVQEISLFPPSVAEVETAIPAFIGYTERAARKGESLTNKPTRISSLLEFQQLFGGAYEIGSVSVQVDENNSHAVSAISIGKRFYLFDCLRQFFDNGGGDSYIVSVGSYSDTIQNGDESAPGSSGFRVGLKALEKVDEPTIILFPDATLLADESHFYSLQQLALAQCARLQDRVGVFDLFEKDRSDADGHDTSVSKFRDAIGINNLRYGATYTPWIHTTYAKNVDFRLFRNGVTDSQSPPQAVNLANLTSDSELNALVSTAETAIDDQSTVGGTVEDLRLAGSPGEKPTVKDRYKSLKDAIRATPDDAGRVAGFQAMLAFMREAAVGLAEWKNGSHGSPPASPLQGVNLTRDVDAYAVDTLRSALKKLIGLEKNDDVQDLSADDDSDIDTAYASLDDTGWLGDLVTNIGTNGEVYAASPPVVSETLEAILGDLDELFQDSDSGNVLSFIDQVRDAAATHVEMAQTVLYQGHPIIGNMVDHIRREMTRIPPSGSIAGAYAFVDGARGVWKAPANVSLSSVLGPVVPIDDKDQEGLNVDVTAGKSINAVRSFTGRGTVIWGARTLAGNDNEWRYVPVRRFFNMVEESVKKSTVWAVFEPNAAPLWTRVKSMIDNYLIEKWREGALAGATPDEAFFVKVGLGQTMTSQDILEGRLNVEIGMAVVRPAEFIILKFSHKLQES